MGRNVLLTEPRLSTHTTHISFIIMILLWQHSFCTFVPTHTYFSAAQKRHHRLLQSPRWYYAPRSADASSAHESRSQSSKNVYARHSPCYDPHILDMQNICSPPVPVPAQKVGWKWRRRWCHIALCSTQTQDTETRQKQSHKNFCIAPNMQCFRHTRQCVCVHWCSLIACMSRCGGREFGMCDL